jgi:hypothetical protein
MDATYLKTFLIDVTKAKNRLSNEGRPARYIVLNPTDHTFIKTQLVAGVAVIGGGLTLQGIPAGPDPQVAADKFRLIDAEGTVAFDSATIDR